MLKCSCANTLSCFLCTVLLPVLGMMILYGLVSHQIFGIIIIIIIIIIRAGIAQAAQRLSCDRGNQGFQSRQGAIHFSFLQKVHTHYGSHSVSYSVGTEVFSSWVKRSEREVNRLSTLTAGVKHEWRYTSIPPQCGFMAWTEKSLRLL